MNEFFHNRLDAAHALIDETQYDIAVDIILNLKTRIHDTTILTQISMHDDNVEKEYQTKFANLARKAGDPTVSYTELVMLKKWRAQEYLKYYDHILREHDI